MEPNELTQNYVFKAYADIKRRAEEEKFTKIGANLSLVAHSNAPWARKCPFVLAQLRTLRQNSLILDIVLGCGDNLYACDGSFTIGMDVNGLRNGKSQNFDFVLADANCPPFRKGLFDAVLLVSVLHHIPSEEKRAKCFRNCLWLASTDKSRIITVVWAKEQKTGKFHSNDVLVPYNLEDTYKLGHTVEIPFNKETTREQRIMLNAVPIRVKVPPNFQCQNYLPKSIGRTMLEMVRRVGWLYPMMSMEFYEQHLQLMANFLFDRLGELKRLKDFSRKNMAPPTHNPQVVICDFCVAVSVSVFDDAFAHLRMIYRDVLKYRYYHLFTAEELGRTLTKIRTSNRNFENFLLISIEYELGNWCAVIEKAAEGRSNEKEEAF